MPQAKTLVVDDDPDLVRAMRLRLRANNYKVLPCAMAMAQSAQKDRPSLDRSRFAAFRSETALSFWNGCRTAIRSRVFRLSS